MISKLIQTVKNIFVKPTEPTDTTPSVAAWPFPAERPTSKISKTDVTVATVPKTTKAKPVAVKPKTAKAKSTVHPAINKGKQQNKPKAKPKAK